MDAVREERELQARVVAARRSSVAATQAMDAALRVYQDTLNARADAEPAYRVYVAARALTRRAGRV